MINLRDPSQAITDRIEAAIDNLLRPKRPDPVYGKKYPCKDEEFCKGIMLYYELGLLRERGIDLTFDKNPHKEGFDNNFFWFNKI